MTDATLPPAPSITEQVEALPALIDKMTATLDKARTAAEVLEAGTQARIAQDAAARVEHLARAQKASDDIVEACRQGQIGFFGIRVRAECVLADEYDAAQERGEVAGKNFKGNQWSVPNENGPSSAADAGISRKRVHEARLVRDVEKLKPGGLVKALQRKLKTRERLTLASAMRAVVPKSARQPDSHAAMPRPKPPAAPAPSMKPDSEPFEARIRELEARLAQRDAELARLRDLIGKWRNFLTQYEHWLDQADKIIKSRKGVLTTAAFGKIRRRLHTDAHAAIRRAVERGDLAAVIAAIDEADKASNDAFITFDRSKLALLSETQMKTTKPRPPESYCDEMMRRRNEARQKRQRGVGAEQRR